MTAVHLGPLQPSLWDDDASPEHGAPPLPGRVQRVVLDRGAWVDHAPGWLPRSNDVFDTLARDVPWRAERRRMYDRVVDVPRLVAWYGAGAALPHPALTAARAELDRHYRGELGEPFVSAGMCLYRDGNDGVAWHGDTVGRGARSDTLVAIVSLGSARALLLRPRGGGADSIRFALGHGDLLVMGGTCQRTWEHAVPKTARATGPRISVQFRPAGVT